MSEITKSQVIQALKSVKSIDIDSIDASVDLSEQGIDSLDMMDILLCLQEKFDVEIEEDSIAENHWSSIDKIVGQLNSLKASVS